MTTAAIIAVSVLFSWLFALLAWGFGYKLGIEQGWKEWEYGKQIHDDNTERYKDIPFKSHGIKQKKNCKTCRFDCSEAAEQHCKKNNFIDWEGKV